MKNNGRRSIKRRDLCSQRCCWLMATVHVAGSEQQLIMLFSRPRLASLSVYVHSFIYSFIMHISCHQYHMLVLICYRQRSFSHLMNKFIHITPRTREMHRQPRAERFQAYEKCHVERCFMQRARKVEQVRVCEQRSKRRRMSAVQSGHRRR